MTRIIRLLILGLIATCVGCSSIESLDNSERFDQLLEAYKNRSSELASQMEREHVGKLEVKSTPTDNAFLLSVDLEGADLSQVIDRIVHQQDMSYRYEGLDIRGRVTAKFEDVPLLEGLNDLLEPYGYLCMLEDRTLVFKNALLMGSAQEQTSDAVSGDVIAEFSLNSREVDEVLKLLGTLYSGPARTSAVQDTNRIIVVGAQREIDIISKIIVRIDYEIPHVLIEAVVVEFNTGELQKLSIDIVSGAKGEISDAVLGFGSTDNLGAMFTYLKGADNVETFRALIDILEMEEKARFISRPYISTLSGQSAKINISRKRYVVVESPAEGAPITTAEAVESGVALEITPTVFSEGKIRMKLVVSDSEFLPTLNNILVEVDSNEASTVMHVSNGQSIVIGGMSLNRESALDSGFPGLKDIPVLGALFGNAEFDSVNQEVLILITPYIWKPGMDIPVLQGANKWGHP